MPQIFESTTKENDYVLYVIVARLPSMNPGKAEAHSGHAASHFMYHHLDQPDVRAWARMANGFGTQINLREEYEDPIVNIVGRAHRMGLIADIVIDPTYPFVVDQETFRAFSLKSRADLNYMENPCGIGDRQKYTFFRPEITAGYVFGDRIKQSSELNFAVGSLSLKA